MEPAAQCMLVVIGAAPEGRKDLVGFQAGMRARRWRGLPVDLEARGRAVPAGPREAPGPRARTEPAWGQRLHTPGLSGVLCARSW